ncbi:MAG: T9SS type A sorting domain-containing protein [Bacteroidia bacterium]
MRKYYLLLFVFFLSISETYSSGHTVSISTTTTTCPGQCYGSATASVSGGAGPFIFRWTYPNGYVGYNDEYVPALCAGTYSVVAIDSLDMSESDAVFFTITESAPITATFNNTNTSGCGQCDGILSATASGGTPPYQYIWYTSNYNSVPSPTNVCAGAYRLIVNDNNYCQLNNTITTLSDNGGITAADISIVEPIMCNSCDGTLTVNGFTGGTQPISYIWTGNQTNQTINACTESTYFINATDANGCLYSETIYIGTLPSPHIVLDTLINLDCNGNSSGTISVHAEGTTGNYQYWWQPTDDTTSTITNVQTGIYEVFAWDENYCVDSMEIQVINSYNIYAAVTTTDANCGDNGTATVTAQGVNPPFTYLWNDDLQQTGETATNLSEGNYNVLVTDAQGCSVMGYTYVPSGCMNIIRGRVFHDTNQNCIQDFGENGFAGRIVVANPSGDFGYTDANGDYSIETPNMNNTVEVSDFSFTYYAITCPPNGYLTVNFTQLGDTSLNNNFGNYASNTSFDLGVGAWWTGSSPGFPINYEIQSYNNSYSPQNALVRFVYDSVLEYTGSTMGGIHFPSDHKIEWTLTNIPGFYGNWYQPLNATFNVPTWVTINDTISNYFEIEPITGDDFPFDNTLFLQGTITAPFDPNAKSVIPKGKWDEGYILPTDSILFYTVHFQNTGNDTAVTVVIKDTLSPFLNPATIMPGASSHPYTFDLSGQGIMTFRFDQIMLPDSNINEPESHGYFNYRVKVKDNTPLGSVIENTAYIYFDFNAPIVTNTTVNTIVSSLSIPDEATINMLIYPNPATTELTVVGYNPAALKLCNTLGQTVAEASNTNKLWLGNLPQGLYLLQVFDNKGALIRVEKVVKE